MDIDEKGLNNIDMKYLRIIIDKYNGGPVGLSTLATSLSEDKQTIEEYIEPYLIQLGFINKTPKGRTTTLKSYKHLGVKPSKEAVIQEKMI